MDFGTTVANLAARALQHTRAPPMASVFQFTFTLYLGQVPQTASFRSQPASALGWVMAHPSTDKRLRRATRSHFAGRATLTPAPVAPRKPPLAIVASRDSLEW